MENKKTKLTPKLLVQLAVMGSAWAVVYLVPYLQYTWYDPFREFMGGTNTQMAMLLTIYGLGNIWGAPLGGWLCDRFNYKILYVLSVFLNAVFSILFIIHPTYTFSIFCWVGFAAASLMLNYPTHIKIVRDIAGSEQGTVFGLNETFIGVGNIVWAAAMMVGFTALSNSITGAVVVNIVVSLVLTVLCWIVLPDPKKIEAAKAEAIAKGEMEPEKEEGFKADKNFAKNLITVLKVPGTWLTGLTILGIYSFMTTLTYFTPYFTEIVGVTVVFTGWLAILRQYGTQVIGAPVGGWVSDKLKSPAMVCLGAEILGIISLLYMLMPKSGVSLAFLIALLLFMSFIVYMARGSYYATLSEAGVPEDMTGSVIGVVCMIGFSPDFFQFILFGHWMDTYPGIGAYNRMFIFQIALLVVAAIAAVIIIKLGKKTGYMRDDKKDIA